MKDEHKERRTLGGATLQNQGTAGLRNVHRLSRPHQKGTGFV